jgi:hypothetical protein
MKWVVKIRLGECAGLISLRISISSGLLLR